MLINSLRLVRTLPCLADPGKIVVVGEPDHTLDAVMPLMNAILPNVISYDPMAGVMTLRRQPGLITFYPDRVMVTQVIDVDQGLVMLGALRDLVNKVWDRRDQIQPKVEGRRIPRPLDIYELLPKINCRACGEATCMAFAFGLLEARCAPDKCPPLAESAFAAQRETLSNMLAGVGGGPLLQPD